jgi:hypothetical protein
MSSQIIPLKARADSAASLMVVLTLPTKRSACTNYCIVLGRRSKHAGGMLESSAFPAIFFAAIIGVIVFIAVSQVLLDPRE